MDGMEFYVITNYAKEIVILKDLVLMELVYVILDIVAQIAKFLFVKMNVLSMENVHQMDVFVIKAGEEMIVLSDM
jgi:hypothetical protein